MDREITQLVVPAIENPIAHERRRQHAIASFTGNIVNAVACDK